MSPKSTPTPQRVDDTLSEDLETELDTIVCLFDLSNKQSEQLRKDMKRLLRLERQKALREVREKLTWSKFPCALANYPHSIPTRWIDDLFSELEKEQS